RKRSSIPSSRPRTRSDDVAPRPQWPATRTSSLPPPPPPSFPRAAAAPVESANRRSTRRTSRLMPPVCGDLPATRNGTLVRASRRQVVAQPLTLCPEDRLDAVGHVDSPEDVRQVRLHGLLADTETLGDQLVRQSVEQEREDLALSRRDPLERV